MRAPLLGALLVLAACAPADEADTANDTTSMAMAPAIDLAALAGTWNVEVRPIDRDTVILTGSISSTADPSTWTQVFPPNPPVTVNVTVSGDSLITNAGPYPSYLRPEISVTTNGVYRQTADGGFEGVTTAHYAGVTTADSVIQLRARWTRQP